MRRQAFRVEAIELGHQNWHAHYVGGQHEARTAKFENFQNLTHGGRKNRKSGSLGPVCGPGREPYVPISTILVLNTGMTTQRMPINFHSRGTTRFHI